MIPGLTGSKMSSSIPDSKIDLLDTPELIRQKISSAQCHDGVIDGNGILPILKEIVFPISNLRLESAAAHQDGTDGTKEDQPLIPELFCSINAPRGTLFSVPEGGTDVAAASHFSSYADLEQQFKEKKIMSKTLKAATIAAIVRLLTPIKKAYDEDIEWQEIERSAYPDQSP